MYTKIKAREKHRQTDRGTFRVNCTQRSGKTTDRQTDIQSVLYTKAREEHRQTEGHSECIVHKGRGRTQTDRQRDIQSVLYTKAGEEHRQTEGHIECIVHKGAQALRSALLCLNKIMRRARDADRCSHFTF